MFYNLALYVTHNPDRNVSRIFKNYYSFYSNKFTVKTKLVSDLKKKHGVQDVAATDSNEKSWNLFFFAIIAVKIVFFFLSV